MEQFRTLNKIDRLTNLAASASNRRDASVYNMDHIHMSASPSHPAPCMFRSNTLFDDATYQRILHGVTSKTTINENDEMDLDEDDENLIKQDFDLDYIHSREDIADMSSADDEDDDNDNDGDDNNNLKIKHGGKSKVDGDEQALSQKFSQLSTRTDMVDIEENYGCPDYLLPTNRSFNESIDSIIQQAQLTSVNYEDFRLMAIDIHQIRHHQILQSLWIAYLQSGVGQLKTRYQIYHINVCLWPAPIRDMVKILVRSGIEENIACHDYVTKRLKKLENIISEAQTNLHNRIMCLSSYSSSIQPMIEGLIDENQVNLREKIQHKIQLIHYDYEEHQMELQYLQYNPNTDQIKLAKQRCFARQQQEVAKCELELLKKHIINDQDTPLVFDSQPFAYVSIFDSIDQLDIRQELYKQYQNVINHARSNILDVYLKSATAQMERYHREYNEGMRNFWQNQRSLPSTQKLSPMMIDLIERRSHIVAERIQCVYNYKIKLLLKK